MRQNRQGVSRRMALQFAASAAALPLAQAGKAASPAEGLRFALRDQPFEADWLFYRGDVEGSSEPHFDDSGWRKLDLPHDWSIEDLEPKGPSVNAVIREADTAPIWAPVKGTPKTIGPFEETPMGLFLQSTRSAGRHHTGHTVGGMGWYRKHFRAQPLPANARVELMFDGVYGNSDVWLNGEYLGSHVYGYTAFGFDLMPHLDLAGENVLAVRVANLGDNSRWYSGSGIYRAVRLNVTGSTRFARWGVRLTTPDVSPSEAMVSVRARIEGLVPGTTLSVTLRDPDGRIAARKEMAATSETSLSLRVPQPHLWSPDAPSLYEAQCVLTAGGVVQDRMTIACGIRGITITPDAGLLLNGKSIKLRGGCVHHDNGLLGAISLDGAEERRIALLKARGFNALRTSHNPPSTAFLNACDRLGMLLIEEAFDVWNIPKLPDDHHLYFKDQGMKDLAAMVERDANHPCVIIWSIGNELPEKTKELGINTARALAAEMRRLDPSRPITAGINEANGADVMRADGTPDQAATQFLDIAGYNYNYEAYEKEHPRFPKRTFVGTESFPKEVDRIWRTLDRTPYALGDFVWTAMDYIGEAGVGMSALYKTDPFQSAYPWFNAFCGDLDLIGQQKPQSYMRDVVWGLSPIEMSVARPLPDGKPGWSSLWGWGDELQSWTWPGQEGRPVTVRLFTRGDRVTLTLNGRMVGDKALTEADGSQASFAVPYVPGKLVASAFKDGKRIGQRAFETVDAPAALRLHVDRSRITASRNDLAYVTVSVVDARGRVIPDDVRVLQAAVSGPVELVAFGNANPRGVASFQQPMAKTWHGRALAVIRPTGGVADAAIEIRSSGLRSAVGRLTVGLS